jgi:hypothetical protein
MCNSKDYFDTILRLLEREDQLTNSRMTWYLTIQGFVIAAVAFIFSSDFKFVDLRIISVILLAIACILISFTLFVSVLRARNAKKIVIKKWYELTKIKKIINNNFPDPKGDISKLSYLTPGLWVPTIFIIFWFIVIIFISHTNFKSDGTCQFQSNFNLISVIVSIIACAMIASLIYTIISNSSSIVNFQNNVKLISRKSKNLSN